MVRRRARRAGRSTQSALVLVSVFGLSLGACGGDGEDAAPTTTVSPPTPTVSPPTTAAPAATTTTMGATTTTRKPGTSQCKTVGFTPNSDDAASSITATGLSCSEAEAFVRSAGARAGNNGPQQFSVDGYRCTLTRVEREPLQQGFFECVKGPKKVTFVRT